MTPIILKKEFSNLIDALKIYLCSFANLWQYIMAEKIYNWVKLADHINEINFSGNLIAVAEVKGKKNYEK